MTYRRLQLIIIALGCLLLIPGLGSVRLFDWDEINFAECAREMIETGNYAQVQIDYKPFYEKPPLFIWLQVLSMKTFGVNEFGARFPNVVVGISTLLVALSIGNRLFSLRTGILWVVCYAGSLLPHFYMRSGIIDPLFNLFIFLSIWWIFRAATEQKPRHLYSLCAGIASGCAVLTKGPVGLGLVGLTAIIAWSITFRNTMRFPWSTLVVVLGMSAVVPGIWIGIEILQHGPTFIQENLAYQLRLLLTGEAGHAQPWFYHIVVVAIGCYPASLFTWQGARTNSTDTTIQRAYSVWMIVLFCVVLTVFSLVTTKIVHYSSLCYLPLTFLAARAIDQWLKREQGGFGRLRTSGIITLSALLTTALVAVPLVFMNKQWLLSMSSFRDQYMRAAFARNVEWIGIEPAIGAQLLVGAVIAVMLAPRKPLYAVGALFGSLILTISLFLPIVAPRIEAYSQGAALDFYQAQQGKGISVEPLSMKSYAHLFYTKKPAALQGVEPTFYLCRINNAKDWMSDSTKRCIDTTGGFVIFQRVLAP